MERLAIRIWTKEEDAVIKKYYFKKGSIVIAEKLDRSYKAVQARALKIGVRGNSRWWSTFEVRYLKSRFGKVKPDAIARTLGRSQGSVMGKIHLLNLRPVKFSKWTAEETQYIREHYHKVTNLKIAVALHRTIDSVELKARREGILNHIRPLSKKEKKYAIEHFGTVPFVKLAKKLNSTVSAMRSLAKESGFDHGSKWRPWTAQEDAIVRELWGTVKRRVVAEKIGRGVETVAQRAQKLGVTKPSKKHMESEYLKRGSSL